MADGDNFTLGGNNAANATTRLDRSGISGNDAFFVRNNNGFAISATGTVTPTASGTGVYGCFRASGMRKASPGVHG